MNRLRGAAGREATAAFSLVELLAVVLVLGVLSAIAVPVYLNTRKTSAARACKASVSAIAAAESAAALREGKYRNLPSLASSRPEGLAWEIQCPLDRTAYTITHSVGNGNVGPNGTGSPVTIACPNAAAHQSHLYGGGGQNDWMRSLPAIATDTDP